MVTRSFTKWMAACLTIGTCLSASSGFADPDEMHGPPVQLVNPVTQFEQGSAAVDQALPEVLSDDQAGSFATLGYQSLKLKVGCWGNASCGLGYGKDFTIKNYFNNNWGHEFGVLPSAHYSNGLPKIPNYQGTSYFRPSGRASHDDARYIRSLSFYSRYSERDKNRSKGFLYTSGKAYNNFSGYVGPRFRGGHAAKSTPATDTGHPIIGLLALSLLFGLVLTKEIVTRVFRQVKR